MWAAACGAFTARACWTAVWKKACGSTAASACRRAERYNQTVRRALKLEQQGTVCIVAPDSTEGMATLTKDKQALETMYRKGWQDAGKLIEWYKQA